MATYYSEQAQVAANKRVDGSHSFAKAQDQGGVLRRSLGRLVTGINSKTGERIPETAAGGAAGYNNGDKVYMCPLPGNCNLVDVRINTKGAVNAGSALGLVGIDSYEYRDASGALDTEPAKTIAVQALTGANAGSATGVNIALMGPSTKNLWIPPRADGEDVTMFITLTGSLFYDIELLLEVTYVVS